MQVNAQTDAKVFNSIISCFQKNDSQQLSNKFANNIDLTVSEADGTYSKQQASIIIKSFFEDHKTTSFKIKHKGASNERTHYAVGDLISGKKKWSVYILLDKESKIIQLQIED